MNIQTQLLPADAVLAPWQTNRMVLHAAGPDARGVIKIILRRGEPDIPPNCRPNLDGLPPERRSSFGGICALPRTPVQVGGHEAELVGDRIVVVYLEGGLALSVETLADLELNGEDLLFFAAGISVTADALPGPV